MASVMHDNGEDLAAGTLPAASKSVYAAADSNGYGDPRCRPPVRAGDTTVHRRGQKRAGVEGGAAAGRSESRPEPAGLARQNQGGAPAACTLAVAARDR